MIDFITGVKAPFHGFRLIIRPGIRPFLLIPLLINTLLFAAVMVLGFQAIEDLGHWLRNQWAWLEWLEWLVWLLWPVFVLISLGVVFFCFSIVMNLIAAPFNGFLAAAVERHLSGTRPVEASSFSSISAEIVADLGAEIQKFLYFLVRALPLLLLFIIPVIQLAAPALWFVFAAWMLAVEYLDFPMANHGMLFPAIRGELGQKKLLTLGFGCGVLILTLIPVVNFIAMPVAVAGATRLYLERYRSVR